MQVLVIGKNDLWLQSFLSLANDFSKWLDFSQSERKYYAVVINAECIEPRVIDRLIIRYSHYPIFFIGNEENIIKKYKHKVLFIPSELEVPKILRLVELYLGKVQLDNKTTFSVKEELVLNCLCEGMTNKEIARYSGLPLSSIKHYLPSIYSKLNIKRRSELALLNGEIIV